MNPSSNGQSLWLYCCCITQTLRTQSSITELPSRPPPAPVVYEVKYWWFTAADAPGTEDEDEDET